MRVIGLRSRPVPCPHADAVWGNRAAALYRHVAGIPTDMEPPVAR